MENKYYTVEEVMKAKAERLLEDKIRNSKFFKEKFWELLLYGKCEYSKDDLIKALNERT